MPPPGSSLSSRLPFPRRFAATDAWRGPPSTARPSVYSSSACGVWLSGCLGRVQSADSLRSPVTLGTPAKGPSQQQRPPALSNPNSRFTPPLLPALSPRRLHTYLSAPLFHARRCWPLPYRLTANTARNAPVP